MFYVYWFGQFRLLAYHNVSRMLPKSPSKLYRNAEAYFELRGWGQVASFYWARKRGSGAEPPKSFKYTLRLQEDLLLNIKMHPILDKIIQQKSGMSSPPLAPVFLLYAKGCENNGNGKQSLLVLARTGCYNSCLFSHEAS